MTETPRTVAETTEYERTSLHADVVAFIDALAPLTEQMSVQSMGASAEGRDIPVLVLSKDGRFTPESAHEAADAEGRPVVMILCNIHAGEVEGKEAGLMLARDMTTGSQARLLDCATVVVVPIYNPDGNDRIDPANREIDRSRAHGQDGPASGVGTRYTGEGFNLNRDYMKFDAVESRHLSKLYAQWNPHVFVDSHTSNGSPHAYALTYDTAHTLHSGPPAPILYVRESMLPEIGDSLFERTGLRTFFYGNFRDNDEPTSGWESYPGLPRYGSHYRGLTGRLDILLEAYSYSPFEDRVRVTYEIFVEILDYVGSHGEEIVGLCAYTAEETIERGRDPDPDDQVGVNYGIARRTDDGELVYDYPGYPLEDVEIEAWDLESMRAWRLLGGELTLWPNIYYGRFVPEVSVRRPRAYLIPASEQAAVDHLRLHNVDVVQIGADLPAASRSAGIERYRVLSRETTASPDVGYEVRRETVFFVAKESAGAEISPGDYLVPMDQPLANVAIYLLEPESDDGLVRWGWFDHVEVGSYFPVLRILDSDALDPPPRAD